jgi:anti-sigma factor RsiW
MTLHDRYKLMISLSLDGMLTPSEEEELSQHLEGCALCSDVQFRMASVDRLFAAPVELAPSLDFSARVMARVEAHEVQRRRRPWLIGLLVFASLLVASAIAAPTMFFVFGLDAWLPDVSALAGVLGQVIGTLRLVLAAVGTLWGAMAAWFDAVTSDPAALAVFLSALVVTSTCIGLLEAFKLRPATTTA